MYLAYTLILCIGLLLDLQYVQGKKCPSFCTSNTTVCTSQGGRIVGRCSNSQSCCDLTLKQRGSCGAKLGNESNIFYFTSPNYPSLLSRDLLCPFTFKLKDNVAGVMLEFVNFMSDGVQFGASKDCDTDMFFIRGFKNWMPPPFCGELTSYKVLIDSGKLGGIEELTLLAVMSSRIYRWKIKVTQIPQSKCTFEEPGNSTADHDSGDYDFDEDTTVEGRRALSSEPGEFKYSRQNSQGDSSVLNSERRDGLARMVVNGMDTPSGKVPWQASLRVDLAEIPTDNMPQAILNLKCDLNEGLHLCGGSIISENEILTAAHCFQPRTKESGYVQLKRYVIVLGDIDKCRDTDIGANSAAEPRSKSMVEHKFANPDVQVYAVESVVLHYAYENSAVFNDVAVVRIKGKITFNDKVNKIDLAEESTYFTGEGAFLSGWGRTNLEDPTNTGSNVLQSSDNLIIQDPSACEKRALQFLTAQKAHLVYSQKYRGILNSTLCTDSKNKTTDVHAGEGDSGGPLVVFDKETSKPTLVGVVSYANHLVKGRSKTAGAVDVDYYQSVAYYRNWIDTTLCAMHSH